MINAPETSSCRKLVQAADGEVLVKGGLSDAEMLRALILWDQTRGMDLCVFSSHVFAYYWSFADFEGELYPDFKVF